MKITIDTKEESKQEIKKLIAFLQKLVDNDYSDYSRSSPEPSSGSFNMFGSDSSSNSGMNMFSDDSSSPSSMDMFGSDSSDTNMFADESNIYDKKEPEEKESFNIHEMLEQY